MANQEHLEAIRRGTIAWNRWRRKHLKVQPDLTGADLHGAKLCRLLFSEAIRSGESFEGTFEDTENITSVYLEQVDFRKANLSEANFEGADCNLADFCEATLSDANFYEADLYRANLSKSDLRRACFNHARIQRAHFVQANLQGADLEYSDARETDFEKTKLKGAKLGGANLYRASFNRADLQYASLGDTDLFRANLSNTNLRGADLGFANLKEANLSNADFEGAIIGGTIFGDVDLSKAKNLDKVNHRSPSTIGIDTIVSSHGNIPDAFLRGAGVPETIIEYMRSLVNAIKPIEYYPCFISYSSKDEAFAERLHADLQSKNVRCWFAREDLKIGDKFRMRIDESIRLYDKLLLILSEHSVASPWVEKEVETAFSKENKTGKLVLFPIKLDNTVMETEQAWAADIQRTRHIGDFTRWKEYDEYQKGLNRLLRDLKQDAIKDRKQ
jgi:uncharacterized protein YjbI with pentapeptide repeats